VGPDPVSIWEGACGRLPAFRAARAGLFLLTLCAADATQAADACAMPSAARATAVRFAIDGDTVRLADGRSLRLIGVNALETGKRGAADEPLAHEASVRLGELLRQGTVRAVVGAEPFDRHGRQLADLYAADGELIAATLAAEGLALVVAVAPNLATIDCIVIAERTARRARRGLWRDPAAWSVAASAAPVGLRGFKRVTGTVTETRARRGGTVVVLDGRLELWIPELPGDPLRQVRASATAGARLAVRGWWGAYRGRPSLRIEHPAVVETID